VRSYAENIDRDGNERPTAYVEELEARNRATKGSSLIGLWYMAKMAEYEKILALQKSGVSSAAARIAVPRALLK
jgi:hypothetical protein